MTVFLYGLLAISGAAFVFCFCRACSAVNSASTLAYELKLYDELRDLRRKSTRLPGSPDAAREIELIGLIRQLQETDAKRLVAEREKRVPFDPKRADELLARAKSMLARHGNQPD